METPALQQTLTLFPDLDLRNELIEHGTLASFNKGDVIVREGQYVKFLPLVLKGSIRVYQQKDEREISLYYVRERETCTMSLAAGFFDNKSTSYGVAAEPTEVLIFPADKVLQWQLKYPSWNRFIMEMFRKRYDDLVNHFEGVAFDPIADRVMEYLHKQASDRKVSLSHQQLAQELGTTRVVISRILKQFEKENKCRLLRGCIELI
jgi:CRP/FNR family transcriptional regulator